MGARSDHEPLWPFSAARFRERFSWEARLSGVSQVSPDVYALRHGGASTDAPLRTRPLNEIKSRGRWRTDSSVRRYNKHARLLKQLELLPDRTKAYGAEIEGSLDAILGRRARAPAPPMAQPTLKRDRHGASAETLARRQRRPLQRP